MKNNKLLSILIPTKNREEYAISVIKQILSIPSEDFQLVIQDNSDTYSLSQKIKEFESDERFNYFHVNRLLSFVDNFSLGLEHCSGEYVIIIGDDDGVMPDIVQIAAWAFKNNIDAITPALPIIYFWPQSEVNAVDTTGVLYINHFSGSIKTVQPKSELIKFLKNGCYNYLAYDLAKAYHGLVKKSILENIKAKTGKYIGGLSPDIYLSVAISLTVKNLTILDYPLTISGICNKSGSADSATGKHVGKLEEAPHFIGHDEYAWSDNIPPFYSVDTIWADSAMAAINELGEESLIKHFNRKILTYRCLKKYPNFEDIILNHDLTISNTNNKYNINYSLLIAKIKVFNFKLTMIKNRILKKLKKNNKREIFYKIKTINEASKICIEYINKSSINIQYKG